MIFRFNFPWDYKLDRFAIRREVVKRCAQAGVVVESDDVESLIIDFGRFGGELIAEDRPREVMVYAEVWVDSW